VGEGGLAEAGRAVEEEVVEGLAAAVGGLNGDAEVLFELVLANELGQATGTQGGVERFFVVLRLGGDDTVGGRSDVPRRIRVLVGRIIPLHTNPTLVAHRWLK
jgi:hypothetical protein